MSTYSPTNLKNAANGIENYGGVADWTQPAGTVAGLNNQIESSWAKSPAATTSPAVTPTGVTTPPVTSGSNLPATSYSNLSTAGLLPGGITPTQAVAQPASLGGASPGGQVYKPITSAPGLTMQDMENPWFSIRGAQTLNQQPASLTGYGQNLLSAGTTGATTFDPSGINESYYATGGQVYQPSGAAQYSETDQARLNEQAMGFAGLSR